MPYQPLTEKINSYLVRSDIPGIRIDDLEPELPEGQALPPQVVFDVGYHPVQLLHITCNGSADQEMELLCSRNLLQQFGKTGAALFPVEQLELHFKFSITALPHQPVPGGQTGCINDLSIAKPDNFF